MPDVQLALGPVVFQDFELPANINFGGRQRLIIHRLAGGRRIIDRLGRDDHDIAFSGVLSGPDASLRARVLDRLRVGGGLLPLTWDVFFYTVTLRQFTAFYQNDAWIPYELSCTVVRDEADGLLQPVTSVAESLIQDVSAGAGYSVGTEIDLSGVLAAVSAPGAAQYGTGAYYDAQGSVADGWARLTGGIASAEDAVSQADIGGTSVTDAPAALNAGVTAACRLAALVQARAFLGSARTNAGIGAMRP